ncbi:Peptidyl-tRNA hydrolase family protein [Spironucleus salmonicida]|uniref:peptidyl-tRNA hydrolase n=1 Tax=Spironucleus salmonicida TaxID=348837 RepID=V6LUM0_9EUKA|nr:Peptidyl-tRNA hydrolase family protein [Spironucleus salmonicida]|eukprot:EST47401.1 Peptidyl-tRNA hydrolase family protein [Spironucleus salmonicida]
MDTEINNSFFHVVNVVLIGAILAFYKIKQMMQKPSPALLSSTSTVPDSGQPVILQCPTLIVLVLKSAKIQKGKICAQVGHAISSAFFSQSTEIENWKEHHKIVLFYVEDFEEFQRLSSVAKAQKVQSDYVQDAGHTQCEAGTVTVGWIGPVLDSQIAMYSCGLTKVE